MRAVKILSVFLFVLFFNIHAQTFDKSYSIQAPYFQKSIPASGNFNISVSVYDNKVYLIKTDAYGNAEWVKSYSFDDGSSDFNHAATKTDDGGLAVFRAAGDWNNLSTFFYLMKFSSEGDLLWQKSFKSNDNVYKASSVVQMPSGDFILAAETVSDVVLFKTDDGGNIIWEKVFQFDAQSENYPVNLLSLNDSSFLLRRKYNLTAFNLEGDSLWNKEVDFEMSFASATADGNIIVSGRDKLLKISPEGDNIWRKNFEGEINFVWGMQDLTSTLLIDYRKVASVTNFGVLLWEKEIAAASDDNYLYSVSETDDHYILISGKNRQRWAPNLIKMNPEGNFTTFDLTRVGGLKNQDDGSYFIYSYEDLYVSWDAPDMNFINIEYTTDGGDAWITIEENYPADSSYYLWNVPNTPGNNCRIRIVDPENPDVNDVNLYPFEIFDYVEYDYIAANEILMWAANNGDGSHDPQTDGAGLYWPGGEEATITAAYEDGLLFGGKVDGEIRVNGNTYRQGLFPGPIFDDGSLADEKDPDFRLFKLKKNWEALPPGNERAKYEENYNNWPMEYGAPYEDINGDGEYTPGVDVPKIIGDETLFYVANGYDTSRAAFTYGSPPMPLELQVTVWAYNDFGMENVVFKKYKMINKSRDRIEDFYFGYWADVDLGFPGDDLSGCDTLLNLGYTYNGDNNDEYGYGSNPPAIGYQIVQGPIVEGNESDSAYFNGSWRKGYKNLPMTNFFNIVKGYVLYRDPIAGSYEGSLEVYNYFQTLNVQGGDIVDPYTEMKVKYMTPGDPVAGTGWYDGDGWPEGPLPRDARFIVTAGPFTVEPWDTQEVVYAIHLARGTDNLNSVTELKKQAIAVQEFYNGQILTEVGNDISGTPEKFELYQNYPNPFSKGAGGNPATVISYQIAKRSKVEISVFDILGRKVATLVNEEKPAGRYQTVFAPAGLSSGVYLIRMQAADFVKTVKAVLLK